MAQDRFPFLADTIRVLWLDDDEGLLEIYRSWFADYPFYHFDAALTVEDGWRQVTQNDPYHVLLYDLTVPDSAGRGMDLIRRCARETACLIATAMDDSDLMFGACNAGAVDLVRKGPMAEATLLPVVNAWFLRSLLGVLPGANAKQAMQRIAEALVDCHAASVGEVARLARMDRSRVKRVCAACYRLQARLVVSVVRAYCAAFAEYGLCPGGAHARPMSEVDLAIAASDFAAHPEAVARFLRRGQPPARRTMLSP